MSCVDGEILIYGWLEPDEAITSIEDYFDENGKCTINAPEHVEVVTRCAALYNK